MMKMEVNDEKVKRAYEEMCQILENLNQEEAIKAILFTSSTLIYNVIDPAQLMDFLDEWHKDLTSMIMGIDAQEKARGHLN